VAGMGLTTKMAKSVTIFACALREHFLRLYGIWIYHSARESLTRE